MTKERVTKKYDVVEITKENGNVPPQIVRYELAIHTVLSTTTSRSEKTLFVQALKASKDVYELRAIPLNKLTGLLCLRRIILLPCKRNRPSCFHHDVQFVVGHRPHFLFGREGNLSEYR